MPLLLGGLPKLANKKLADTQIDTFGGGSNLLFSETRLKKDEAKEATNLMLIEDGIWDKRWGTKQYGPDFTAVDGAAEYRKSDGTTEMIVIDSGTAYRTTATAKTAITGASFTAGYQCFFCQIGTYLYIGNGYDALAYYDGSVLHTYTALTVPANATATRGAGLSAGAYTYYYRVTAVNAVGETTPCAEFSTTVNKDRDTWSIATEIITLDWDNVTNAIAYVVYFSDTTGYETKLTEVTASTFVDDGSLLPNPYIEPPTANTTGGPKLKVMTISGNRIWGTDPNEPYKKFFSGAGAYLGNFAPAYGGGWVGLEVGGKDRLEAVIDFQGSCHGICASPEGRGSVWRTDLDSVTIGTESVTVPIPTKLIGKIGSESPLTVILVGNDVIFLNEKEVTVLGNEPGVLNVLRTNEISSKIRPYIQSLSANDISKACAYYYDAKVFFSVPTTVGAANDRIVVFDRERMAWIKDWTIGVKQFLEHTDPSGVNHFLGVQATKLIEFSSSYQGDDGTAFQCKYKSPRIPMSKDWTQFAKIKRSFIKLRNVEGAVQFKVAGTGKDENFNAIGAGTIAPGTSDTGMGWDPMGSVQMGSTAGVPTTFAVESLIKFLVVNKLIRDIQFEVYTSGDAILDRFVLTGLRAEGFLVPTGKPSSWKLS